MASDKDRSISQTGWACIVDIITKTEYNYKNIIDHTYYRKHGNGRCYKNYMFQSPFLCTGWNNFAHNRYYSCISRLTQKHRWLKTGVIPNLTYMSAVFMYWFICVYSDHIMKPGLSLLLYSRCNVFLAFCMACLLTMFLWKADRFSALKIFFAHQTCAECLTRNICHWGQTVLVKSWWPFCVVNIVVVVLKSCCHLQVLILMNFFFWCLNWFYILVLNLAKTYQYSIHGESLVIYDSTKIIIPNNQVIPKS